MAVDQWPPLVYFLAMLASSQRTPKMAVGLTYIWKQVRARGRVQQMREKLP